MKIEQLPFQIILVFFFFVFSLSSFAIGTKEQIISDCLECPKLVRIPTGQFLMGSLDGGHNRPETPPHIVLIRKPFALGLTEITYSQFEYFVQKTGYKIATGCRVQSGSISDNGYLEWIFKADKSWRDPNFKQIMSTAMQASTPVVCVGRVDALAYVRWLSEFTGHEYRLPSESEWEYAARAGSIGIYYWGNNADQSCEYGNVYDRSSHIILKFGWSFSDCDDGFVELSPVAKFKPNLFGLYDMIGNVWEWTEDCYQLTYDQAPTDGAAMQGDVSCEYWSVRGGGWMTRPSRNRLTFRGRDPNEARYSYFGFRVARSLP